MNVVTYDLVTGELGFSFIGVSSIDDCNAPSGCGVLEIPDEDDVNDYVIDLTTDPHTLVLKSETDRQEIKLNAEKANALAILAKRVELEQSHHITKNKEMIYRAKEDEVTRYESDPAPVEANYPFAHQHVAENGGSIADAIVLFKTRAADTKTALVQIDAMERQTKSQIQTASVIGEPNACLNAAVWPSAGS